MARVAGIDLPNQKRVDIALTYLYGIGRSNVHRLLLLSQVDGTKKIKDLTEEEVSKIQKILDKEFTVEGNLRVQIAGNVKRLKEIGSYRGLRHTRNLPSRGQRTRSNARTKRGARKTVGALKKEIRAQVDQAQAAKPAEGGGKGK
ncbi:30S ribosomal protein S13 [Candidatus Gottesmanbacteria bacterium RIFCSPHIGHO2_02_FULL_39_11]|uniref:Small ribosomal subunit protein uS13 n=1 Tax=Candidatus Gottesmanbacteria bacterium RIFCSPHIGHO2_02_FULL_39_11 TaxID=1798382 RepID=A0A1F5ZWI1_9BACT|nr:MAG: 30S ribosomal protein S13 [Candidatus Gottesmanbacteria bacterium RIFCSPHIGHO2_02_FULL_39_11]